MAMYGNIGIRMKEYYENISKYKLTRKIPVAIRIDGKAFHTFTKNFEKPFDEVLNNSMVKTMEYLCENIQGCVFGYTQSDEITLIIIDYQRLNTQTWFNYEVQKMTSISASMATMAFNKAFSEEISKISNDKKSKYTKALSNGAMFDSRCFNIPKEEVCNLIYWRQLDAIRNSIQMVGQTYFSHKNLHKKSCSMIKEILLDKNIDWEKEYPVKYQRGVAWSKEKGIDYNIPIFKNINRNYINNIIYLQSPDKITCKFGYQDCINDPVYLKKNWEKIYYEMYGNKTVEDAAKDKDNICMSCVNGRYYDDEDK